MASRVLTPRRMMLALLCAWLAGCQGNPQASTPATPATSASTTAGDSVADMSDPGASPGVLAPLPGASVDSDLDPSDQEAIQSSLSTDQVNAYLDTSLIHDGGVILLQYRTLDLNAATTASPNAAPTASDSSSAPATPETTSSPSAAPMTAPSPGAPPEDWKRDESTHGGRQIKMRKQDANGTRQALVTVTQPMYGVLDVRSAPGVAHAFKTTFHEAMSRTLYFRRTGATWELTSISPIAFEAPPGKSNIVYQSIAAYADNQTAPIHLIRTANDLTDLSAVPTLQPGQKVRLVVKAAAGDGSPIYLYAHLVGSSDRARETLVPDATHPGAYTCTFIVPKADGLHHLAVDAIAASSFQPGGPYVANSLGLSFNVKAGI